MTEERRDFYVYVLLREDGVTPFYVGKGCGRRVEWHTTACGRGGRTLKDRVARKVVAALGRIPYQIVFNGLTDHEAQSAEVGVIAALGRRDIGTGILANMTNGGDGGAGHATSDEVREARRRRNSERMATAEGKAASTAANNRRFSDPKARAAIGEQSKLRWVDDAYREATGRAIAEALSTPAASARITATNNARWAQPGAREAHAEKMRILQADPEIKAKQSLARKAYWEKRKAAA